MKTANALKMVMVLGIALVMSIGCSQSNKESPKELSNENRLAGTYKGVLPCASCEGIETTVVLTQDGKFTQKDVYVTNKTGQKIFEDKGIFSFDKSTSKLTTVSDSNETKRYFVADGFLEVLDAEDKRQVDELAKEYVLKKQ